MALLEKAARQGHAYAMCELGMVSYDRREREQALKWLTKVGRCKSKPVLKAPGFSACTRPPARWP
jgi:hypothetical protein